MNRFGRLSAALLTVVVAGCGLTSGGDRADVAELPVAASAVPEATESAEPDDLIPEDDEPEASPAPSATRNPPPRKKPRPKRKPVHDKPPSDAPRGDAPGCAPKRKGKAVSRAKAKAALTAAAARTYWPVSAPEIKVPGALVKAVAWQESGWQSNVYACDGGVGLMQVMPDTAGHINQRFEQSYDIDVPTDNAMLGANYLAWLTKYFGDAYFGETYPLAAKHCDNHTDMCLLNMVISAYNYGYGAVDAGWERQRLPNPRYVDNVRSLMKNCACLKF